VETDAREIRVGEAKGRRGKGRGKKRIRKRSRKSRR